MDARARRWQADTGDTSAASRGAGTRFTVVDRGLGRVALRWGRAWCRSAADGRLSLRAGTPGAAETFQWIETFTGELTLLSLATKRYVRLDADTGVLRADARARTPTVATACGGDGWRSLGSRVQAALGDPSETTTSGL